MYRRLYMPNMWREMNRLQSEVNRLFDGVNSVRRTAPSFPAMNVWTSQDGIMVTAEVPGVKPEDIDVSVVGDTLTLSGQRRPDDLNEGGRYHRQERGYGKFVRTLQLPFPVKVDHIEATFRSGVLNVQLPRSEEDKPRKISVRTA
jgi:HSP20 family protein